MDEDDPQTVWWREALPALRSELASYCRNRYPAVPVSDREDIVQETLLSLSRTLEKGPKRFPTAWWGGAADEVSSEDRDHFVAVAKKTLGWRASDHFREIAAAASSEVAIGPSRDAGTSPRADHSVFAQELVLAAIAVLAEASPAERDLVRQVTQSATKDSPPLTAAERKRMQRLRERLIASFGARLGKEAVDGLQEILRKD